MRLRFFTDCQKSSVLPWASIPSHLSLVVIFLCTIFLMSKPAAADAEVSAPGETLYASEVKTASPNTGAKQCNIYENDTLHAVMDRICELCHNMFSHENPNMRAQCRSDGSCRRCFPAAPHIEGNYPIAFEQSSSGGVYYFFAQARPRDTSDTSHFDICLFRYLLETKIKNKKCTKSTVGSRFRGYGINWCIASFMTIACCSF